MPASSSVPMGISTALSATTSVGTWHVLLSISFVPADKLV